MPAPPLTSPSPRPGEVNVGGIVAAVVVLLMVLALVAFGVWFAYSRGFFSSECRPAAPAPPRPPCSPLNPPFCFFDFREERVSEAVMLLPPSWLPPLPLPAGTGGLLPAPSPCPWAGTVPRVSPGAEGGDGGPLMPFAFCSAAGKKVIYSQPSHRSDVSRGWGGR